MKKQVSPPGWSEEYIRKVIDHYEKQTEEEELAEFEAAFTAPGQTIMSVPTGLVPVIARLIENHQSRASNGRAPKRRPAKTASRRQRKPARR